MDQQQPETPQPSTFLGGLKSGLSAVVAYVAKVASPAVAVAIIAGVIYAIIKYKDLMMSLLVKSTIKEVDDARAQDAKLKTQEDTHNDAADDLVKQAQDLAKKKNDETDEDWYKK